MLGSKIDKLLKQALDINNMSNYEFSHFEIDDNFKYHGKILMEKGLPVKFSKEDLEKANRFSKKLKVKHEIIQYSGFYYFGVKKSFFSTPARYK